MYADLSWQTGCSNGAVCGIERADEWAWPVRVGRRDELLIGARVIPVRANGDEARSGVRADDGDLRAHRPMAAARPRLLLVLRPTGCGRRGQTCGREGGARVGGADRLAARAAPLLLGSFQSKEPQIAHCGFFVASIIESLLRLASF